MKLSPSINDLVTLPESKTIYIVRHVVKDQKIAKICKMRLNGELESFGYQPYEMLKRIGSLLA